MAKRVANRPDAFSEIRDLLSPKGMAEPLWYFGGKLAEYDLGQALLQPIIAITAETRHRVCLHGYLATIESRDPEFFAKTIRTLMREYNTAQLAVEIQCLSEYEDSLFSECLDSLEKDWVGPEIFACLRKSVSNCTIPIDKVGRLLRILRNQNSKESQAVLTQLLDSVSFDEAAPINKDFVFEALATSISIKEFQGGLPVFYWKRVAKKLLAWDSALSIPTLEMIIGAMKEDFSLSYSSEFVTVANDIVRAFPRVHHHRLG